MRPRASCFPVLMGSGAGTRRRLSRPLSIGLGLFLLALSSISLGAAVANVSAQPAAENAPALRAEAGANRVAEVREEFTPENRRYSAIRVFLSFLYPFYAAVAALVLLMTGLSARMRDFAHARARSRYGRTFLYLALFLLATFVLEFPLAWFSGFALEHRFQLSNQSFFAWFGEQGIDLGVGLAMLGGTGLVALAYRAIEKYPRGWWWRIALGVIPVTIFMTIIQPVFIEPLYNKFEPLRDKALEQEIVALAAKADIPGRRVFQVDRSKQTKRYNAYVNGFGASQRIVLWDTILEGMSEDELLFVMGHEMGHYKLGHMWKGIALASLGGFAVLFLCWRIATWLLGRFGGRWGFTELHDLASLPLFALTLGLLLFVLQPIDVGYTRTVEHEADVFGLEVTKTNDAATRAFIKLGSQNRSDPEPAPIVKFWLYSHPPLVERVRFAMEYHPWEEGKPNRLFHGEE